MPNENAREQTDEDDTRVKDEPPEEASRSDDEKLDEAGKESFPASDPPAF